MRVSFWSGFGVDISVILGFAASCFTISCFAATGTTGLDIGSEGGLTFSADFGLPVSTLALLSFFHQLR